MSLKYYLGIGQNIHSILKPAKQHIKIWDEVESVTSSNLAEISFEFDEDVLEVKFVKGATYYYYDVPELVYKKLLKAKSKGKYFHDNVRFSYDYQRID
jgi:hypothetical protein